MKQNINVEQLEELTVEQLKKLYKIIPNPSLWRIAYRKDYNLKIDVHDYIEAVHSITIGRILEALINNIPKSECIEDSLDIECDRATGISFVEYRKNNLEFVEYKDKELCDALWDAVKDIL